LRQIQKLYKDDIVSLRSIADKLGMNCAILRLWCQGRNIRLEAVKREGLTVPGLHSEDAAALVKYLRKQGMQNPVKPEVALPVPKSEKPPSAFTSRISGLAH
jgi:hypothetical protein